MTPTELPLTQREELLDRALTFTRHCRETIQGIVSKGFSVKAKADQSLVTTADTETEKAFRAMVDQAYPLHGVLGEEFGHSNPDADFQWIIDPIDGTEEFARGMPLYGTIIGLHYRGQPLVGVIDIPELNKTYSAALGLGACCNNSKLSLSEPALASPRLGMSRLANFAKTGAEQTFHTLAKHFPNQRIVCSCFAHACAASGALDCMAEWNVAIWDLAAAQVLVEEAGGKFEWIKPPKPWPGDGKLCAVFGRASVVDQVKEALR